MTHSDRCRFFNYYFASLGLFFFKPRQMEIPDIGSQGKYIE